MKAIYTVDYFQNPTGLTLSVERRKKLVELAKRYSTGQRILILEDAAYRELRFDGDDLPSIKRFDPTNEYVIYTSTFSKPCAPGAEDRVRDHAARRHGTAAAPQGQSRLRLGQSFAAHRGAT